MSRIRRDVITSYSIHYTKLYDPVIPEKGSVGASGDLAPMAHMALVLIGMGEAFYRGKRISGADALKP